MSPIRMSEIESAIRLVLKFYTAFNKHDVSELTKLISDDCRMEAAVVEAGETELSGSQAIIQYWDHIFHLYPKLEVENEEVIGAGNRCIARFRYKLLSANGENRLIRGVDIFRVQTGLIKEILCYAKTTSLFPAA